MKARKMARLFSLLLALVLCLSFVACGGGVKEGASDGGGSAAASGGTPAGSKSQRAEENSMVVAMAIDVASMDPMAQNTTLTSAFGFHIYDTLLKTDPFTGELSTRLAESYEQTSDTEYVFKLKEGIKFHNGDEVKASDVKYSIERCMVSAGMAAKLAMVDTVEVEDDYTVKITTKYPAYTLLNNLSFACAVIMSEKWNEEHGDNFEPMGSGPYKFVEWKPGEHVLLERNDDYWGEKANVQSMKFVVMSEDTARTIALETGDIDVNLNVSNVDFAKMESNADLQLVKDYTAVVDYLGLSWKHPETTDPNVRLAIAHAVNKQDYVDVALEGYGRTVNSLLGSMVPGYYADLPEYEYDLDLAKSYLAESNYPDGFELVVTVRFDKDNLRAQILQGQLQPLGITVKIDRVENAVFLETAKNGEMMATFSDWGGATSDADNPLRGVLYSENGGTNNRTWYSNPAMDKLLDDALKSSDQAERDELYKQVQQLIYDDVAVVPLLNAEYAIAARAEIKGIFVPPIGEGNNVNYAAWSWE